MVKFERLPRIAILVGGRATRLWPRTATIPKSMIEVAGEPFIAHQLRLLVGQGINEIVLCCGLIYNLGWVVLAVASYWLDRRAHGSRTSAAAMG